MGARYPWESALTGDEVCPAVAEDVRDQEVNLFWKTYPFKLMSSICSGPYKRGHITGSEDGLGLRCGQRLVEEGGEGRPHCLSGGGEDSGCRCSITRSQSP